MTTIRKCGEKTEGTVSRAKPGPKADEIKIAKKSRLEGVRHHHGIKILSGVKEHLFGRVGLRKCAKEARKCAKQA